MSVQTLSWAMTQQPGRPIGKLVLIGLANTCGMNGELSFDGVREFTGMTLDAFQAEVAELYQAGFIESPDGQLRLACPTVDPLISRDPSKSLRKQVLEESGFICVACRSTERLCVDHIIPKRRGGMGDRANLQVLCARCNTSKGSKLPDQWSGRKVAQ
jgi:hypothetical protein